ncbi:MAG TPA: 2-oxoacid:acceptor oxidoreductase family protein, partial [Clostridia bacterium]|nr:2-oxoacid:acceptor oxidoreductase family protein [Clostridia bacterium]
MAHHEIVIAGFGGQGIMSAGNLLAYAGMMDGKNVSWYPVYGPEKRGGTAACHVIVSDDQVGSPILNNATALLVMNTPSLEKFESWVKNEGLIISDSSITDKSTSRKDVTAYEIPATQMASDMGNLAYANIIML